MAPAQAQAIAYIQDDELVEVTPRVIRIRKGIWIRMSGSGSRGRRRRLRYIRRRLHLAESGLSASGVGN
jgi:hypothetical protein